MSMENNEFKVVSCPMIKFKEWILSQEKEADRIFPTDEDEFYDLFLLYSMYNRLGIAGVGFRKGEVKYICNAV